MECTCHVRVLWLWWWLYSTARALVCISWQMGFSAPLVLPVMMSHVPVYQTGHTQISPHLLLSQSPIPLPSVFIFLPLQASVFLSLHAILSLFQSVPLASIAPQECLHLYLQTVIKYTRATVRWLHDSFAELWGEARTALTTRCAALIIAPSWCVVPIPVP